MVKLFILPRKVTKIQPLPVGGDGRRRVWFAAPQMEWRGSAMRMFQVCVCGEPLQCNEAPTPEPKGTEVLLKELAAGVCHSDLHLADGWFDLGGGKKMSLQDRGMKLPVTLGHENVGE